MRCSAPVSLFHAEHEILRRYAPQNDTSGKVLRQSLRLRRGEEHTVNLQELTAMYDFTGGASEYLYRLKAQPK